MAAEGTRAVVAAVETVTMVPADNSGNCGGRQWRRQVETEAAAGADNNQPESGSNRGGRNSDRGSNGDGGRGGSRDGGDGGADSACGGANSSREGGRCGGRCGGRRYHVDTNIGFP